MTPEPRHILVIHFGQLGDVVLSLPALRLIRERFPHARITVTTGRPNIPVIELSGYADDTLAVDRVAIRDGSKLLAGLRIAKVVRDVRRRRFDFVIDLHSLSETNLLGLLSGAPRRLYAKRRNSLDYLANVRGVPGEDLTKHVVERYLDALAPLGVRSLSDGERTPQIKTHPEDERAVTELLRKTGVPTDAPLIGIFPGAGHPSKRWDITRFIELARWIEREADGRAIFFVGPEERDITIAVRAALGRDALILDRLTIPQLAAALARLSVLVSNDTGPVHVAAAMNTPTVVLVNRPTPNGFAPVGSHHHVIYAESLERITVPEVYQATHRTLSRTNRTASIFAS